MLRNKGKTKQNIRNISTESGLQKSRYRTMAGLQTSPYRNRSRPRSISIQKRRPFVTRVSREWSVSGQCNDRYTCVECISSAFERTLIYHIVSWVVRHSSFFSERELTFTFTFAICYRPSVCRLSFVCNVRAPYSAGWNFRQFFSAIWYHGHPLTSTENFTEIIPGEPLHWGFKRKRGSQI